MNNPKHKFTSVDEYIASFAPNIQAILQELRATIKAFAPNAEEKISYQMPTYAQHGNLVYFGAHKNHVGFYPAPRGIEAFAEELASYKGSKGTVQFPYNQPLPLDLIGRIVAFRVAQNVAKAAAKPRRTK